MFLLLNLNINILPWAEECAEELPWAEEFLEMMPFEIFV